MWQRHSALTQTLFISTKKQQISVDVDLIITTLIILGILDIEPSRSWDLVTCFYTSVVTVKCCHIRGGIGVPKSVWSFFIFSFLRVVSGLLGSYILTFSIKFRLINYQFYKIIKKKNWKRCMCCSQCDHIFKFNWFS